MIKLKNYAVRLLLVLSLIPTLAKSESVELKVGKGEVVVYYDPTQPDEKTAIVWLSYCIGRLSFVVEHRTLYPNEVRGEWVPTFREEVKGRFVALDTYDAMVGKDIPVTQYWEELSKVQKAKFLDEYVWTYLYRKTWPDSECPKNLKKFDSWRKKNLVNHKVMTYGTLKIRN